ncbi:MAG: 3-hydroxyacyl-ACP dehydratase FabZ [Candidatus Omnitrophota bacterium]
MDGIWNIDKIQEVLPQKYPFIFIDQVLAIDEEGKKVVCLKNVTINDYFFKGHFPGNPVMPGTIIIEAMAQASIIIYSVLKPHVMKKNPGFYLGKVEAKFKKAVVPGDQLILEAVVEKIVDEGGIVNSSAKVDGVVVSSARVVFGVKVKSKSDK